MNSNSSNDNLSLTRRLYAFFALHPEAALMRGADIALMAMDAPPSPIDPAPAPSPSPVPTGSAAHISRSAAVPQNRRPANKETETEKAKETETLPPHPLSKITEKEKDKEKENPSSASASAREEESENLSAFSEIPNFPELPPMPYFSQISELSQNAEFSQKAQSSVLTSPLPSPKGGIVGLAAAGQDDTSGQANSSGQAKDEKAPQAVAEQAEEGGSRQTAAHAPRATTLSEVMEGFRFPPVNFKDWTADDFKTQAACNRGTLLTDEQFAAFVLYWTEADPKGRMRFQKLKSFSMQRRLMTWLRMQQAFEREEQARLKALGPRPKPEPPTEAETVAYAESLQFSPTASLACYLHFAALGWTKGSADIADWQSAVREWLMRHADAVDAQQRKQKSFNNHNNSLQNEQPEQFLARPATPSAAQPSEPRTPRNTAAGDRTAAHHTAFSASAGICAYFNTLDCERAADQGGNNSSAPWC